MLILQDITDNSPRFVVQPICRSYRTPLNTKPVKGLAFSNAQKEIYAAKKEDKVTKD